MPLVSGNRVTLCRARDTKVDEVVNANHGQARVGDLRLLPEPGQHMTANHHHRGEHQVHRKLEPPVRGGRDQRTAEVSVGAPKVMISATPRTSTASTAIAAFTASHTNTPPVAAVCHPRASRTR